MKKDTFLARRRKRKNEKIEAFTFLEHDFAPFEGKVYLMRAFVGFIFIFIDAAAVFSHEKKPIELIMSIVSATMLFILARCFMLHRFRSGALVFLCFCLLSGARVFLYSSIKGEPLMAIVYVGFIFYYVCAAIGSATINTSHHPMALYYIALIVRGTLPFLQFNAKLLEELPPQETPLLATVISFGASLAFAFLKMYFDMLTLYIVYHKPRLVKITDLASDGNEESGR